MNAVVTIAIGNSYRRIARLTHPMMKAYADRIGAEFIVVGHSRQEHHHFDKLYLNEWFDAFDRIIFLDADTVVSPDCPNLFTQVPSCSLGMLDESDFANEEELRTHKDVMKRASEAYGIPLPKHVFYNTGVIVASRMHAEILSPPDKVVTMEYGEQPLINLRLANSDTVMHPLEAEFNCMPFMKMDMKKSHIAHYAGLPDAEKRIRESLAPPPVLPQLITVGTRLDMLDELRLKGKMCAEIGVNRGWFSNEILAREPERLYMIDPWVCQSKDIWPDDHANVDIDSMEDIYYQVLEDFHGKNATIIRDYSINAARRFGDMSLDFVYIDAIHTMESVLIDMATWWPKVKPGGWLCGHDYATSKFPGVTVAVDSFAKIAMNPVRLLCMESWSSWGIRK